MKRLLMVVLALGACGGKKDDKPKESMGGGGGGGSASAMAQPEPEKKGAPPKEVYKGKNRLVNLLVSADGKTQTVDVWVRRGFKYDPVKLAENVEFGKASTWFGVPEHMSPVVLPVGAKPDDKEISPMAYGKADEVVTGVMYEDRGSVGVTSRYDVSKDMTAPAPAPADKGVLILDAGQLSNFEKQLTEKFGGRSFYVGDGAGNCLEHRDEKMRSLALGGTATRELALAPGKVKISLHKWPAQKGEECKSPAVYEFEAEASAGKMAYVFVYTPDAGKSLATVTVPFE